MPEFKVTVGYNTVMYKDIIVEAATNDDAERLVAANLTHPYTFIGLDDGWEEDPNGDGDLYIVEGCIEELEDHG